MYFVIAAMKGELRVARGDSGGLAAPGGRGGGHAGGGVGAPARVHVQPRGSYSNPTGPPGPLQRRHWNPEERSACLRSGELDAWARSPLWRLLSRCHSLGCAWHPAGLPKESLPRVAELGTRREGLVTGRKLGTSTLGPQGPHPGTTLAWKGGGVKEAPGRALLANTGGVIAETG